MITSAILLAAGRGERMRPLTDTLPKPLIPVHGKPLIVYHIEKLANLNIKNIIINISYLADQIKDTLGDGSAWGVNITYSHEPEALETGGGIFQALPLLGNKPFLVISSDIYTNYDFGQLIRRGGACLTRPLTSGANLTTGKPNAGEASLAPTHLILVPNPSYHLAGDFSLEKEGFLGNNSQYTYANIALLHPNLFKNCKAGKFRLAPLLREAIENKQVTGELYNGEWWNIGTVEEWEKLNTKTPKSL